MKYVPLLTARRAFTQTCMRSTVVVKNARRVSFCSVAHFVITAILLALRGIMKREEMGKKLGYATVSETL